MEARGLIDHWLLLLRFRNGPALLASPLSMYGGGVALAIDPLRRHGAQGLGVARHYASPQSSTEACRKDQQATVSGTVGHSFACFAHVLTSVRVLKGSEEGMLLGFSVAEGFRLHATWAMSMKCWQKLMHTINGNSAAAPADPWASFLASKQPAVRAKWEDGLEIEPGQLQVGGGDVTKNQAGAVKVDAEYGENASGHCKGSFNQGSCRCLARLPTHA